MYYTTLLNNKPLIKVSVKCEVFEMALNHKSKMQVYRELKFEFGFEEYLEYVKVAPSCFSNFC